MIVLKYCIIVRDNEKSKKIQEILISKIKHEYNDKTPDYVVAVGGDGTIIKASHKYPNAVIFGIHTGHLGHYANYSVDELDIAIENINNSNFKVQKLDVLAAEFVTNSGNIVNDFALNEVTIVSPLRTLILDVWIDNDFLERYRGTGLCISTPSGSTAYNKSLHGSVIDSRLRTMQLTEMAGINSTAYKSLGSPIVLSYERRIKLDLVEGYEARTDLFITVDHISYSLRDLKSLYIFYNNKTINMAYNKPEEFVNRINRSFLISKE